ncbi:predicted protein [Naegleria gruberi]|uniref:Predicted protein n=1 Tax=Naegleria gruberi TaxID=5762 RepID=D2VGJ9_NAEGR|nr:uncharacterized protein NAEGRDRAFT_49362 [Naegleria gruberi]EFC43977.1 predicted protein [Naegleria gruberi]|eukprot:XP_002676721.1 predicted protein [Naegleria gruberi strain NEG-M]
MPKVSATPVSSFNMRGQVFQVSLLLVVMLIIMMTTGRNVEANTLSSETKLEEFVECPFEYYTSGQLNTKKYDQLVAECAFARVPFQYETNTTDITSLFIKRIRKRDETNLPRKIVWFIPGGGFGPGHSTIHLDVEMVKYFISELYNRTDNYQYSIYSVEHRGVGRSDRLSCQSSQAESPSSDGGYYITKKEWPKCVQDLSKLETLVYSSDNAAIDLLKVMKMVKTMYSDSIHYMYGYYYGAFWIMKTLRFTELNDLTMLNSIKGIMIENPFTKKFHLNDIDSVMIDTFKNVLKFCSDKTLADKYDKTCYEKLGGQDVYALLKSTMKKVYNVDFDSHSSGHSVMSGGGGGGGSGGGESDGGHGTVPNTPCGLVSSKLPFYNLTRIFGSLMRTRNGQAIIPAIIYRFNRCDDSKDVHILYNLVKYYATYVESKSYATNYLLDSDSVFYNIVFSEFWKESHQTESEISEDMAHSYVNTGFDLKLAQVWNATHHWEGPEIYTPKIDTSFSNPTNIPILVIDADADTYMTSDYPTDFESSLSGTNHKLVTIPFSLPPTIVNSPVKGKSDCGSQILTSLITLDSTNPNVQQVNTQCLDQLQFNFTGSSSFNKLVFQVSDIYEGVYVYSTFYTGTISTTLFFAVVLGISIGFLVVLIVAMCVTCTMRLTFLNNKAYKKLTSSTASGHDPSMWNNL